jgi:hypothetical protein
LFDFVSVCNGVILHFWAIIVTCFCWTVLFYWGIVLNFVPFVQCNHPALLGNRCETCLQQIILT